MRPRIAKGRIHFVAQIPPARSSFCMAPTQIEAPTVIRKRRSDGYDGHGVAHESHWDSIALLLVHTKLARQTDCCEHLWLTFKPSSSLDSFPSPALASSDIRRANVHRIHLHRPFVLAPSNSVLPPITHLHLTRTPLHPLHQAFIGIHAAPVEAILPGPLTTYTARSSGPRNGNDHAAATSIAAKRRFQRQQ